MYIAEKTYSLDEGKRTVELRMVANSQEVDQAIRDYFDELNQNEVPGFRKGKAPKKALEQGVGGHAKAYGEVAQRLVDSQAFKVVDDADIMFLGDPEFHVDAIPADGQPLEFRVTGTVAPVMELSSYEPVSIQMPPDEATDAEVEHELREMQSCYYSYEPIDDPSHQVQPDDYVTAVITCTEDGEIVFGLDGATRMFGLGTGAMPPSFDQQVLGATVGQQLEFDFVTHGDSQMMEADANAGADDAAPTQTLHAQVQVNAISRRILPDLDDEFAAKMGAMNMDDLRRSTRFAINEQKNRELPQLMQEQVVAALAQRLQGDVPQYYVDFMRQGVSREFVEGLKEKGTNLQEWLLNNNVDSDAFRNSVMEESRIRAANDLALEALFAHMGWEVTKDDLQRQASGSDDPQELLRSVREAGRMADVRKMCRQQKAVQWLVKTAEVEVVDSIANAETGR